MFHTRAPSFLPPSSFSHILLFHNIEKRVDVATNMKPMQNCFGLEFATICSVSMFSLSPENTHGNARNSKTTFCHTPEKIQTWELEQQLYGDGHCPLSKSKLSKLKIRRGVRKVGGSSELYRELLSIDIRLLLYIRPATLLSSRGVGFLDVATDL